MQSYVVGSGNGCSFDFPDGLGGEFITHNFSTNYVVPAGKNLYITNLKCTHSSTKLEIDGLAVYSGYSNVTTGNGEKINMPIIAKEGQSLTHGTSSSIMNGILIDATVTPITHELSTNYIVPSGKKLFITNLRCTHQTNELKIDGEGIYSGYSNVSTGPGTIIKMPIMVSSGQEISHSTQTSVFNGYLVDENYFANCGGVSVNATSIENMQNIITDIQLSGNQGFQNGDFNYWENMSFIDSAMFVVPENKIMLIESKNHANIFDQKLIRDNIIYSENNSNYLPLQNFADLIFKENDTIIFNSQFNSNGNNSYVHFTYFLYDNSDNLIEPLYKVLTDSTVYNIPSGKKLLIENKSYDCADIYINSPNTGVILHSSLQQIPFYDDMSIISDCYCNSCNQCPTFYNCYITINGYLIDD